MNCLKNKFSKVNSGRHSDNDSVLFPKDGFSEGLFPVRTHGGYILFSPWTWLLVHCQTVTKMLLNGKECTQAYIKSLGRIWSSLLKLTKKSGVLVEI